MKKYKIGFIFGKFYPLHVGHINLIRNAVLCCEKLYIVICRSQQIIDYNKKKYKIDEISLGKQVLWLIESLPDVKNIVIETIDETNIPRYPNGTKQWAGLIREIISEPIDAIFSADIEYKALFEKTFPEAYFVHSSSPRSTSSTQIKEMGIYNAGNLLPMAVRHTFGIKCSPVLY